MTITIDKFVDREIHLCASHLVATLAKGYGDLESEARGNNQADLAELFEQAMEACTPILDWEEAAIQEGWHEVNSDHAGHAFANAEEDVPPHDPLLLDSWEELCDHYRIEPYEREIMEHWAVSDWLADKLEERGERIVRDMASMTIWGRTTSGQGIAQDSVIKDIFADMVAA